MAKVSSVERNKKRARMIAQYAERRAVLKARIKDRNTSPEDRFRDAVHLAQMPRNGSKIRYRNLCALTGRPRGVYRKFALGRIALRSLASKGHAPGVTKSSW